MDADQREFYERHGYLIVKNAIPHSLVGEGSLPLCLSVSLSLCGSLGLASRCLSERMLDCALQRASTVTTTSRSEKHARRTVRWVRNPVSTTFENRATTWETVCVHARARARARVGVTGCVRVRVWV